MLCSADDHPHGHHVRRLHGEDEAELSDGGVHCYSCVISLSAYSSVPAALAQARLTAAVLATALHALEPKWLRPLVPVDLQPCTAWLPGHIAPWSHGFLVTWLSGHMACCSHGLLLAGQALPQWRDGLWLYMHLPSMEHADSAVPSLA